MNFWDYDFLLDTHYLLSAISDSTYHELKVTHRKDPFDRMLIWQAIRNNLTLISSDVNISKYKSEGLNTVSK